MTEREAALEARATMLAAFGAKAAHDFNNLLAVILGNVELVEEMVEDADAAQMLRLIREAGERGEHLAAQLMLASASEASTRDGSLSPTAAAEARAGDMLGLQCHIGLDAGGTSLASVDGAELESALVYLCASLRRVLPEGSTLSIRVEAPAS